MQACNPRGCGDWTTSNAATPTTPPAWAPTHYGYSVTQQACPEPDSTYGETVTNGNSGCTMNARGYLQPGTVIDAICLSVRNGKNWYYFQIEDRSYDGWFIRISDTNGTIIPNC